MPLIFNMGSLLNLQSVSLDTIGIRTMTIGSGTSEKTVSARAYYSGWYKFETIQYLTARNFNGVLQNYLPQPTSPIYTYWFRLWGVLIGDVNFVNMTLASNSVTASTTDNAIRLLAQMLNFDISTSTYGVLVDHDKRGAGFITYPNLPNWNESKVSDTEIAPGFFGYNNTRLQNVTILDDNDSSKSIAVQNTSNFINGSAQSTTGTTPEPPVYVTNNSGIIFDEVNENISSLTSVIQLYDSKGKDITSLNYGVGTNTPGVSLFFKTAQGAFPVLEVIVGVK